MVSPVRTAAAGVLPFGWWRTLADQDGFFDPLVARLDRVYAEGFATAAERSTIEVVDTVAGVLSCLGAVVGVPVTNRR